jgi:hypothetical protein
MKGKKLFVVWGLRRWKQVKGLFLKLKCENNFKGDKQKVTNENITWLPILKPKLVVKGDGWDMKCLNWVFILHSKHKKCETS